MRDTSRRVSAGIRRLAAVAVVVLALLTLGTGSASAHVVPWTTVQLDVQDGEIDAALDIPLDDVAAATGIDLGDETQADVDANATAITTYLANHVGPTSDTGQAWAVTVGALTVVQAGDRTTTGLYRQLTTTLVLTPPAGADERSFNLGYTAIVDKVITHVVVVTVTADWAAGNVGSAYELGTIALDTTTNTVPAFHVDLDRGSTMRGFLSMVSLGIRHIQTGTDHQLFLLALLLPAPLLAAGRRWRGPATTRQAIARICRITTAFTLGHSVTLALGTLGLPVPQQAVEAAIAVSIIVAAVHAFRPLFPGREALVAASFGLVHGLAFSEALRELHLSGSRLVLSLLGFNLGIEAMQLLIVALVLPPLVVLARTRCYRAVRTLGAATAGVAATGWLAARLGDTNVVADAADGLDRWSAVALVGLWTVATAAAATRRYRRRSTATHHEAELDPSNRPLAGSHVSAGVEPLRAVDV